MIWIIVTKEEFEHQFRDLTKKDKPLAERLAKAILKLEENLYLGKPLSHDLSGLWSLRGVNTGLSTKSTKTKRRPF